MPPPADPLPEHLRRWHRLLVDRLAHGPDPVFADIARQVRSGRMTLHDAALSPAYRDAFAAMASRAARAVADHSPAEVAEAAAAKSLEDRIARLEAESRPAPRPAPSDDDGPPDTYLVGPPVTDRPAQPPRRERWNHRG